MEKKESNLLIAVFMGAEFINDHPEAYPNGYYVIEEKDEGTFIFTNEDILGYDQSWDWLMPVIDKIESIPFDQGYKYSVNLSFNTCGIQRSDLFTDVIYQLRETKIEATYRAVIEFIKMYNNGKQGL